MNSLNSNGMIALIAAIAENRVIGKDGRMPWHIPEDLRYFKRLTLGNVLIMGRRTYEVLGRPFPERLNIVLSTTQNFDAENCMTVPSMEEALRAAGDRDIFIIGGEGVFRRCLPMADMLFLTEIERAYDGDTFFPEFSASEFEKSVVGRSETPVPHAYVVYRRIDGGTKRSTER